MDEVTHFKEAIHEIMGPCGFWVQETRVKERQTVLNWGVLHPMNNQAILFGVACAEFGSEEDVFDLALEQLRRRTRGSQ